MVQFKTKIAVEAMTFNANGGDALGIKGIVTNKGNVKIDYNELENKPGIYTKTEIDGKVSAINSNISNVERRVTTLETKGTGSGSGSSTTGSISPIRTHSTALNKDYNAKNITINGTSAYVYDTTAMESIVEDVLAKGGTGSGTSGNFDLRQYLEDVEVYDTHVSPDSFVVFDEGNVKRIANPINPIKESLLHLEDEQSTLKEELKELETIVNQLREDGISDADIKSAVDKYLTEHPVQGGIASLPDNLVYFNDTYESNAELAIPLISSNGSTFYIGVGNDGKPFVGNTSNEVVWTPEDAVYENGDEVSY